MQDSPDRMRLPNVGVEEAHDERELRFLYDKHPDVPRANIQVRYSNNKSELMRGAKVRHLIPALALKITNRQLLDGQTDLPTDMSDDGIPMAGFEESLDERDLSELYGRFPTVDPQKILDLYTRNREALSEGARIRDFIPVLAMNLTEEQLRKERLDKAGMEV